MKKLLYLCSVVSSITFFDVFKPLVFLCAVCATSCTGLYTLNKAIAYEIRYNKVQHTDTNLDVSVTNNPQN